MSVNSKMTALADEIRILSGTEDTMGLDAMKNNVNAANSAVSAALTALTEKGVEVPDGTIVSGLAELIGAIETGGNILDCSYAAGSFTVAQNCIKYNIMSLSDLETLFDGTLPTKSVGGYWLANGYTTTDSSSAFFGFGASPSSANYLTGTPYYISGSSVTRGSGTNVIGFTGLEGLYVQSYSYAGFRAGTTYNWILIKIQ